MKSRVLVAIALLLIAAILYGEKEEVPSDNGEMPFDVNQVVEKVSKHIGTSGNTASKSYIFSEKKDGNDFRDGEFLIDTNVIYIPAARDQWDPSVAFDGTNYLVVWSDLRGGITHYIYGARVDQSGNVLDPAGIAISTAAYWQRNPSVAFDGTNYLVVWHDQRNLSTSKVDIYGTRVDTSGNVLDPDGIAISTAAENQSSTSVAFDGTNYLVVWSDDRNYLTSNYDIYGARVDQSGNVLDPAGIAISTAAENQSSTSVAFDGTNYLVVWEDGRGVVGSHIYGARVDQSGNVLDPAGIAISTPGYSEKDPEIAFDGTNYLVVWSDYRNLNYDIYGARVDTSGNVLDPAKIAISTAAENQLRLSVAFDGTDYLVVWYDERTDSAAYDIYGARVDTSGNVLDPDGIAISTAAYSQRYPSVAFDGTNYLVVWEDERTDSSAEDIYGARVDQSGAVLEPAGIAISTAAYSQWEPEIAFDGTNYLVVWSDDRNYLTSNYDIYGACVNQSGDVLNTAGIAISTAAYSQWEPEIAFDGTNYLVVWEDERTDSSADDIYGARVDTSGNVLDPDGIAISTAAYWQRNPSVAFNGTSYLVVWSDNRNYLTSENDIYGARVDQSGNVLDPAGIAISTAAENQSSTSVAFDGTNYLVVWDDWRNFYTSVIDIYGARVDQSGAVLDPAGIVISDFAMGQWGPSVAFDGTNYLVVWSDDRNYSTSVIDIYGARVDTSGNVLDPDGIAISTAAYSQRYPSVAFDGTDYIVVWQDERSGPYSYDIYGARVDQSGVVTDSFAVSTQPQNQTSPAVVHGTGDQIVITYSAWTDSINTHPANAMRIWGKSYPFVGIEEETELRIQTARLGLHVYPNPFTQMTDIRYQISVNSEPELDIFDVTGRLVRQFDYQTMRLSDHIMWYGDDDVGRQLPSGVYFLKFVTEDYSATKKLLLIK